MKSVVTPLMMLFIVSCVSTPKKPAAVQSDRVTVMTMNVENLFDTEDDPNKNDETFLPARLKQNPAFQNRCRVQNSEGARMNECLTRDWNETVLERKFRRLADVVAQVGGGQGPDILFLQEVENRKVLEMWRDGYLKSMGYTTLVHIEGPDERGIDTAILSRLPLVGEPRLHLIDYSTTPELQKEPQRPTRGVLQAELRLPDGSEVSVFAVHFPSQGATTIHRKAAADTLLSLTSRVPAGKPVVVGGDFNITSREEWKEKYFRDLIMPKLSVSHMVGCGQCAGTTYWSGDGTWSFFDVLLFSKDLDGGNALWQLDRGSIHIVDSSRFQYNEYGSPAGFKNGFGSVGVSDHLPMYAELKLKTPPPLGASR